MEGWSVQAARPSERRFSRGTLQSEWCKNTMSCGAQNKHKTCWCLVSWLANVTVMFIKRDSKAEHWGWQLNRSDPVRTKSKLQTRIKGKTGSNDGNENENAGSRQTHKHRLKSTGSDSLLRHRCTQRKESSQVTKLCSLFFNLMTWLIAQSCELIAECPAFLCPSNKWQNALWWF